MGNPLMHIMGPEEAAKKWGIEFTDVIQACVDGKLKAIYLDETFWVINKNQPNPFE
jgi:hypothetical protein